MFTDIEGSTRLLEELGTEAYRDALAEHRRIVREACARHAGYEVDTEGDSFFYAFRSAQHAVEAIAAAMRGLDGGPIRIRVGIHTGEPALDPPNYIGLDVHRAARIMASAHGGQVVLSPTTVALLDGTVALRPLGEHRLKDMSAPLALSQLLIEGLPDALPAAEDALPLEPPRPYHAVPRPRGRACRGRTRCSRDTTTRLLTLTGPGGTGKTRLALRAAADASDRVPGRHLVDPARPAPRAGSRPTDGRERLRAGRAPGRSPGRDARPGVRGQAGAARARQPRAAAARRRRRDRIAGRRLPARCASSSRVASGSSSAGEREYLVDSLTLDDAVGLLRERAAAVGVELADDDAARVLVERLERLPLAIELAAARLKLFTPTQLVERLGDRLDSLKGGRDADPRQQTLRATVAWSYDLLDPGEKQLLCRLSSFRGGCTLEAAEAVCDAEHDGLQSLLDKSLLRRSDTPTGPRIWVLETIREYAAEPLARSGELQRHPSPSRALGTGAGGASRAGVGRG